MRIIIATLFPEMCEQVLSESIIGRARRAGKLDIRCVNIRDYSQDKHHRVDDSPYGGGKGMLMQVEPIFRCWEDQCAQLGQRPHCIYLSPKGQVFSQKKAIQLKEQGKDLFLLCGHYEGVDQRVLDEIVDEEISIGDYVLTGGELGALVLVDAIGRLCEGVLPEEQCFTEESHYKGLLEYPQYTRPPLWHGQAVPEVLLSGHHAKIVQWQREQSLQLTLDRRPDMLAQVELDKKDRAFLRRLEQERAQAQTEEEA